MQELAALLQRVKENEEILKKFHLLETKILAILNLKDFFENLLTEMITIFQVPYVWVTVIKGSKLAHMVNSMAHSDIVRQRMNFIDPAAFDACFSSRPLPLLVNTDLAPYREFFPGRKVYEVQSMALAPVYIDGETVGSLNQGDRTRTRFEAGMDTSLLEQLTIKISLCLSNAMAHERLHFFAFHDPLTGLLNRRAFEVEFQREFSRARRHGSRLSVVYADLDDFKRINDQFGHETGDRALQLAAQTLEKLSRKEDIVSRFAGDEFVLLLPETGAKKAKALMARMQKQLANHPLPGTGEKRFISISYGVASSESACPDSPELLLKKADQKLYAAKKIKRAASAGRQSPPCGSLHDHPVITGIKKF